MSAAGQASERTPDFIPGWFKPREGNADTAEREAVRFIGTQDFPINFLRPGESVRPARQGLGVNIDRDGETMSLAVPPGYWMVRDADGRPHLWSDEDFKAKWVRNNGAEWIAPVERAKEGERGQVGHIGYEGERGGEEQNPRGGWLVLTHDELDRISIPATSTQAGMDGPPRGLTLPERMKLIVKRYTALAADKEKLESALAECFILSGEEADGSPPSMLAREAVDAVRSLRNHYDELERKDVDRDDAWVSEVAYQAGGAVSAVFLSEDPEKVMPAQECIRAVGAILTDFGIEADDHTAEEQLEHGAKETSGGAEGWAGEGLRSLVEGDKAAIERLYDQRESARAGEDRYKAERDSALHLVRWLIGDIIPPDLIRLGDDEEN